VRRAEQAVGVPCSGTRATVESVRKKGRRKKRKERKRKRKRENKRKKREKEKEWEKLAKFWKKLGKMREKGKRDFGGIFRVFGCRHNFRDDGDGEAD
jgi:hypothetical protein